MKKIACCLISFLVTVLVVVGAVFGAGWYAYDRYAKDITGITYLEAWNVLSSLYGTKEKKVITNPFDADAEFAAVDAEIKKLLFIDESVDFSLKAMMEEIMGVANTPPTEGETAEPAQTTYSDAIIGTNELAEVGSLESFMNTLKFDFSELKDYNGAQHILEMTDKQIGAILNEAVMGAASKYTKGLAQQGVDVQKVFGVRELKITSSDDALTANENTTVSAVIKLDLRDVVESLLNTHQPKLKFLKGLLPKALYLTLEMKPFGEGLPTVKLNDNNEKENALAMKLLNGVLNYSAGTKDVDKVAELFGKVDATVKKTFNTLDNYLNIVFTPSEVHANPLQFLVKKIGAQDMTDTDLLYTISYLMHEIEGIENINWDETKVAAFFTDFKAKMPIEKDYDLNVKNFADELKKIGNHIDLNAMDFNTPNDQMRLFMNYDAVAGFVEHMFLSDGEGIMSMVQIRQINMPNVENAERDQLIHFVIEVAAREYLGIDKMADGLKKSLLDAMVHDIYIDATVSATGVVNADIGLLVNGLNAEQTTQMLTNLDKLISVITPSLAGQFKEDVLISKIENGLTKALTSMKGDGETPDIDIKFTQDGIEMQSIYEIIKTRKNVDELTAEEIRLTLKGVMDTTAIEKGIIGEFDNNKDTGISVNMDPPATVAVSDAYIADLVKDTVNAITVTGGGTVELKQVLFADLSDASKKAGNKLWNNEVLREALISNGMSEHKVLFVTTKLKLTNEVFKNDIYMSVIYDITSGNSTLMINDMSAEETNNLAILIQKLSGTAIDFDAIANDVIDKILKVEIKFDDILTVTVEELIADCEILNRQADLLGCGVISKQVTITL